MSYKYTKGLVSPVRLQRFSSLEFLVLQLYSNAGLDGAFEDSRERKQQREARPEPGGGTIAKIHFEDENRGRESTKGEDTEHHREASAVRAARLREGHLRGSHEVNLENKSRDGRQYQHMRDGVKDGHEIRKYDCKDHHI